MKVFSLFFLLATIFAFSADTYTWGNVRMDGGGFVSAVIPSKQEKDLVYVRTDVGGAYRWNPVTSSWIPLMDFISENDKGIFAVEALALDPSNSDKLYMLGGISYFSNGKTVIFRSNDRGATFEITDVTSLFKAHGNGKGRQSGERLAVDPNNGNILYCGSRLNGLFKSTDGGVSWAQASTIGSGGSDLNTDNGISFVIFDAASGTVAGATKTIYVGVSKNNDGAVYVSHDAGGSFTKISGGPAAGLLPLRAALSNGKLYVAYANGAGPDNATDGALYTYNIASGTWANISPSIGDDGKASMGGFSVDPKNPEHIIAATTNLYNGQWMYSNGSEGWGDRIYRSTDGGATWALLNPYQWLGDAAHIAQYGPITPVPSIDPNGTAWLSGHAIHWAGSLEFDPFDSKKVWVTSGNGVFRTDNITVEKPVWKFVARGIEETVPLDMVSIPEGPLVTAIGDYDGAAYDNITASTPVHSPQVGTTESMGYAPLNGRLFRVGTTTDYSVNPPLERNLGYVSADKGATWTALATVPAIKGMSAMNADGSVLFHRGLNTTDIFRSADNGVSWAKVSGLDFNQTQYSPLVPDPVDVNVMYIMASDGSMWVSSDKGLNFVKKSTMSDYSGSGKIRIAPGKTGHLWVPLDANQSWASGGYSQNGLAFSEDGGVSFSKIAGVETCVAIGLGKEAPAADYYALYMWGKPSGGVIGIYRSIDKGASWERINDDRHQFGGPGNGNFVMGDFNTYGRVYMSTVGRGLVYGNIGDVSGGVKPVVPKFNGLASLYQRNHTLEIHVQKAQNAELRIYGLNGKLVKKVPLKNGPNFVSLAAFPKGAMLIRVADSRRLMLERMIVIR